MNEARNEKGGVPKAEQSERVMDPPRGYHLGRRKQTGPAGGLPFPVTPETIRFKGISYVF